MVICTVRYSLGRKRGGSQNWSERVEVGRKENVCPLRESNGSFSDAHAIAYPLYQQRLQNRPNVAVYEIHSAVRTTTLM
jgi:hypothetical protein